MHSHPALLLTDVVNSTRLSQAVGDAEIARLRGQLDTLSKERELTALSRELATLREGKKNVGSAAGGAARAPRPASAGGCWRR